MALGVRYTSRNGRGYLQKDQRALLKSVPRLGGGANRLPAEPRVWPRRLLSLLFVFFISFSLLMVGGAFSARLRDTFHRAALLFSVEESMVELRGAAEEIRPSFSDVFSSDPAARAVGYLRAKGILQGYPDGTFRPGEPMTRAALLFLIGKVNSSSPHAYINSYCFKDVQDQWFAPFVCAAKKDGWVSGYENNLFKPEKTVSRAEGIKIIVTVFGRSEIRENAPESGEDGAAAQLPGEDSSTGAIIRQWFDPYLEVAENNNWLPLSFIRAEINDPLSRGETAEILYRIISSGGAIK